MDAGEPLEERLRWYVAAFEHSLDAIALIDAQGRYIAQNAAHRALTGFEDEDLRGRTPAIHLGEEGFQRIAQELQRTGQFRGEAVSTSKHGAATPIDLSAAAIRDDAGRVVAFVGIKRDVRVQQQAQAALRTQLAQQQALYELGETVLRAEAIEEIHQAALQCLRAALGADRAAILLFDERGTMRFEAWHGLSEAYRGAVEGHSPWKPGDSPAPVLVEDAAQDAGLGALRDVVAKEGIGALAFRPLLHRGRLLGKLMVYYDAPRRFAPEDVRLGQTIAGLLAVSLARRRGEEALRQAHQRLKELDELKTRFLDAASHELRTPITPIALQLQLLKARGSLTEPQQRALEVVQRNVDRLNGLLAEVLDVARMQSGRLPLRRVPFDLGDVLQDSAKAFDGPARQAGLELEVQVAGALPVLGDAERMGHVFTNLLANALKATPRGGRIRVRAEVAGKEAVARVVDTGAGLVPAQLAQVFEPFAQLGQGHGGLGLFISKGIVEQHGGRIEATSPGPGQGCAFLVALPLRGATLPPAAPSLPA
jgi:PAS domain S-box-containing protein